MKLLPKSSGLDGQGSGYSLGKKWEKYNPLIAYKPYYSYDSILNREVIKSSPQVLIPAVYNSTIPCGLFHFDGFNDKFVEMNFLTSLSPIRTHVFTFLNFNFEIYPFQTIFSLSDNGSTFSQETIFLEYDFVGNTTLYYIAKRATQDVLFTVNLGAVSTQRPLTVVIRHAQNSFVDFYADGNRLVTTSSNLGSGSFDNSSVWKIVLGNTPFNSNQGYQGYLMDYCIFNSLLDEQDATMVSLDSSLLFSASPFIFPISFVSSSNYLSGRFTLNSGNLFYGDKQAYLYEGRQYAGLPA